MHARTKRHSSNSRSKSKGSKQHARDQSTENHSRHRGNTISANDFKSKVKTEQSVHRGKPLVLVQGKERHRKSKLKLKHEVDKVGCLVAQVARDDSQIETDRHIKSVFKPNKTEAAEDDGGSLRELRQALSKIVKPRAEITELKVYYKQVQRCYQHLQEPLYSMLAFLHKMYTSPLQKLFDIILPFEALLIRREQLSREVEQQIRENERLHQLQNFDKEMQEIVKLKEVIQKQGKLLDEKRDIPEKFRHFKQKSMQQEPEPQKKNSFKLGIDDLKQRNIRSYDDEFRDHIKECSESWRNQYLNEKRF